MITSKEFFINMKSIPDESSEEYSSFFANERDKIQYGLTINGVYIPGWLYWHTNHWKINQDALDPRNGDIIRKFKNPQLRDNEWLIAEHIHRAEQERKGLLIIGSRRLGKSIFAGSYIGRNATIYQGTEHIIAGGNWLDIGNITSVCDMGLNALHPFFQFSRLNNDPKKAFVLGIKDSAGNRIPWSHILMRNLSDGNNTEALAGPTPKSLIIDEVGKFDFLAALNSAKKSFVTSYGWRVSPILTGTGGSFVSQDAELLFNEPEKHNFLSCTIPDRPGKQYGLFISGLMSLDVPKNEMPLSQYLDKPKGSELDEIKIMVVDKEVGLTMIEKARENARSSKDDKTYLKEVMYAPLTPEECFLSEEENIFNVEACKEQLAYLEEHFTKEEEWVSLYRDVDGKVVSKEEQTLTPIRFPHDNQLGTDGPIIIYERPLTNAPDGLYIAGADPYNQDDSAYSDSLGTCFVYKRMYDAVNGTFQNSIVASYTGRPKTMRDWHEKVELLLDYYNAVCMPENEGRTFIQYFDAKNRGFKLAEGYSFLKEISPMSKIAGSRSIGLPATTPVIKFCMNLLVEYLKEPVFCGYDEKTNAKIEKPGVIRIKDRALLQEIINWKKGLNVDRIVAFRHALAYDKSLEKIYPIVQMPGEIDPNRKKVNYNTGPFILSPKTQHHKAGLPRSPFT